MRKPDPASIPYLLNLLILYPLLSSGYKALQANSLFYSLLFLLFLATFIWNNLKPLCTRAGPDQANTQPDQQEHRAEAAPEAGRINNRPDSTGKPG